MSTTFSMIKSTAIEQGLTGRIISDIEANGFKIVKMRMLKFDRNLAEKFYESLNDKPFFGELCDYMTSGNVIALVLEKENAVQDFRQLIGATNPSEAAFGTIRQKFGVDKMRNAVHGSDSDINAERESKLLFN